MARVTNVSDDEKAVLRNLLQQTTLPRDALPYSVEFPYIKGKFYELTEREMSDADFWHLITKIGKKGGVAKRGNRKKAPRSPRLSNEEQLEILRLLPDGIGLRDNLPYTREFDRIHRKFTQLTETNLNNWDFWRVVLRLAKRSRKPEPVFDSVPLGDLHEKIAQILETLNPWWIAKAALEPPLYRRWAFEEAWCHLVHADKYDKRAVVIRGSRRVGKSTIMSQIIEQLLWLEGVHAKRILYVQFDEIPGLGSLVDPILSLVRWYEKNVLGKTLNESAKAGEPAYLFFDEIQNIKDWDPQLKFFIDHAAVKVLVTGSSSLRILQGRDSLAGRLSTIDLGPLRLSEIAGIRRLGKWPAIKNGDDLSNWVEPNFWLEVVSQKRTDLKIIKDAFRHFSDVGGYPTCHSLPKASKPELARNIADFVVERTIDHDQAIDPRRRRSWDRRLLKETFRLLCRYAGQHIKAGRICEEVNSVIGEGFSKSKVDDAIQFMVDAMLVHSVDSLEALNKRRRNGAKYCLCDHFIREAWLHEKVPLDPVQLAKTSEAVATVAGHIIESIVGYFFSSIPELEVAWLPERKSERQPEVDFILTIGLKRIPVEIKYVRRSLKNDDFAGLERFCAQEKYNAPFGLIITQKEAGQVSDSVIAVPVSALLSIM